MNRARQSLWIVALAGIAVLAWQLVLGGLPRPALAESNYHANRLRLEAWFLDPVPSNVLAGSSISGRLLPGYFGGTPLAGAANLGLDGSGPLTALDCILLRATNGGGIPRRVFLEIHRLDRTNDANDRLLLAAAQDAGLKLADALPAARAAARPSTLAYAWLKERKTGGAGGEPAPGGDRRTLAGNEDWLVGLEARLQALQRLGVEVVLVRLPVGRENPVDPLAPNFADAVCARLGLPLVDLNRLASAQGHKPAYTDGLHLTPDSARWAAQALGAAIR
jgi:hypothetical protein